MKPYQLYTVKRMAQLRPGQTIRTQIQLTFSGQNEDVETVVTMEDAAFEGNIALLRVKSEIRHETFGFIKTVVNNERRKLDFTEYLEPVDFPAFYDAKRSIAIFQAPKKVCRGVLANLRANTGEIDLCEMSVDFGKLMTFRTEYFAAWFRGVSARVRAAGLSGDQIQDDALFKKLLRDGQLSNVTIPWELDGAEHRVMITSTGAVVLVQDYKANQGLELQIVTDVHDELLTKVWEEKKSGRAAANDGPGEP